MPIKKPSPDEDYEPGQNKPNEADLVRQYAFEQLQEMGFSYDDANALCERTDIVHEAMRLIGKGCSVELAVKILA